MFTFNANDPSSTSTVIKSSANMKTINLKSFAIEDKDLLGDSKDNDRIEPNSIYKKKKEQQLFLMVNNATIIFNEDPTFCTLIRMPNIEDKGLLERPASLRLVRTQLSLF